LGKRSSSGFDMLDTPLDQVYGGKDGEQSLSDRAVSETAGLVATSNGKPIQALFMATGGGATVDNTHVFGSPFPYLKGVSNYPEKTKTIQYKGISAPQGDQSWLSWDIARLAAEGLLQADQLNATKMLGECRPNEIRQCLVLAAKRLDLPAPPAPPPSGVQVYIWMARAFNLDKVVDGIERQQDAVYFLQDIAVPPQDRVLAGFLTRLGVVSPQQWRAQKVTMADALLSLAKMWAELEPMELREGTLLLDGLVRPKNQGPGPLRLGSPLLLLEEYPGGQLSMVGEANVQVGDSIKWLDQEGGSRLLVRRLNPDGTSYDTYCRCICSIRA
jgi:stage II sporulation protein D